MFYSAHALLSSIQCSSKKDDPLAAWKPKFDPAGVKYSYLLSTVAHPTIHGVSVGYRIRDKVWGETGGKIYVDFGSFAQLDGDKDVMRPNHPQI